MFPDLRLAMIAAVGGLIASAPAAAASFDCAKASAPLELAICADAGLSAADEGVALFYRHLLSPACRGTPGLDGLVDEQRAWVAHTRQTFHPGEDGVKALALAYSARRLRLDPLVDACGVRRKATPPLSIETLQAPASSARGSSVLPWVQGASPEIGWRINQALFMELIDLPAPERRDAALATLITAPTPGNGGRTSEVGFAVVRNDGRVLVIEASYEGCGAYCEGHTEQLFFDARTGRSVPTADLLTRDGAKTLARRSVEHKLREGRARLAQARRAKQLDRENDEEGTYRRCLSEWSEWAKSGGYLYPIWLGDKNQWHVHDEGCSAHVNRPQDLLDRLHMPLTMVELRPLLSAYGRSLLLGEGDVRSPVEAPGRCEGPTLPMVLTPPTAPGPRFAADEDGATWLAPDGQPFVWPHQGPAPPAAVEATPWRSGERYVALARGQGFSAGLREDGSLWTWGNNYQGRLGLPQLRETHAPQFLLSNVAQVMVDANVGLALRRDGTLWVWGDAESVAPRRPASPKVSIDPSPRPIFEDVAQAVFGPQGDVLALRRDGGLWRIGGPEKTRLDRPLQPPQRLGDGFVRLAGHGAEAAWRADGMLWAWNLTLRSLLDVNDEGLPPVPVARDVVQVLPRVYESLTALLKSDGSVWVKRGWGGTYALRRASCGVGQLARADEKAVLALRTDGQLVLWSAASVPPGQRDAYETAFAGAPIDLGSGFTALWPADLLHGNATAPVIAVRGGDELWITRTSPRSGEPPVTMKAMLQRMVPVPDANAVGAK